MYALKSLKQLLAQYKTDFELAKKEVSSTLSDYRKIKRQIDLLEKVRMILFDPRLNMISSKVHH